MKNKKIIATLIAVSLGCAPNVTFPVLEKTENLDTSGFDQILTSQLQWTINEYNRKEQERLAYEEWLRQEEYKRLNPEFPKYDLSEDELVQIARLCQQEQGTLEGSAAEASLMANRYELYGDNYINLYNYVRNSGWFEKAGYYMDYGNVSKDILELIRQVLIEGKRTLPKYVDEHCCIINVSINTGNYNNQEDYIPFETKINDDFGGSYTFYDFPGTSDPFGYTSEDNREKYGEDHYDFERILTK